MTRFGNIGQNAQLAILGLLPIAALFGNAAADIALVLTVIIYLSTERDAFRDLRQSRFFQLAFVFWVWICICSAVSLFPKNSFQDSLPWIRFPLFAFALANFLADHTSLRFRTFITSAFLGTLIQLGFMYTELLLGEMHYHHLSGTYAKPVAGWYIVGFGLIVSLFCSEKLIAENTSKFMKIISILIICLCGSGLIISKETMNSILFISIFGLIFTFNYIVKKNNFLYFFSFFLIMAIGLGLLIFSLPHVNNWIMTIESRFPWNEGSDFFPIWKGSIQIFVQNIIFGIGPKNSFLYTSMLEKNGALFETLGLKETLWHSHNMYIQTMTETGLIGLILFMTFIVNLILKSIKYFYINTTFAIITLTSFFIMFFPLQTYSNAFGQFRNLFFWVVIGYLYGKINTHSYRKI